MYDNDCSNNCRRQCSGSGVVCISLGYLAVIAAIVAGVATYLLFNAELLTNIASVLFGVIGVVVLLGIVLIALVNVFLTRGEKLCCCAKQRALWFVAVAIITLVAIGLYFAIPVAAAVLLAIVAAFFVLTVILFVGFYQCFLRCRCNECVTDRCD